MSATTNQVNQDSRQINILNLRTDSRGSLVFSFRNNANRSFALTVLIQDTTSFNSGELESILDCLVIAQPCSIISSDLFDAFVSSLQAKFYHVSTPQYNVHTRFTYILPSSLHCSRPHSSKPHSVTAVYIRFFEQEIGIPLTTNDSNFYLIALETSFPNYGLSTTDCRLLTEVLTFLYPCTSLSPTRFFNMGLTWHKICGSVRYDRPSILQRPIRLTFTSLPTGEKLPSPPELLQAATATACSCPSCKTSFYSGCMSELQISYPHIPHYPRIRYTEKIRENRFGGLYRAVMEDEPCTITIFSERINSDFFFRVTFKALPITPSHPSVCRVLDSFQLPKPAIRLGCLEGSVLAHLVVGKNKAAVDNNQNVLKLLLLICEGISFLHTHGFVHHNLTLHNIILNQKSVPVIFGFELGYIETPDKAILFTESDSSTAFSSYLRISGSSSHELRFPIVNTESFDNRIDVACLGVIMWEMFTGKLLFREDEGKITEDYLRTLIFNKRDDLLSQIGHVHHKIRQAIKDSWCTDRKERPKISDLLVMLQKCKADTPNSSSGSEPSSSVSNSAQEDLAQSGATLTHTEGPSSTGQNSVPKSDALERMISRPPVFCKDRNGKKFDAYENYEKRYPKSSGSRKISLKPQKYLKWVDALRKINLFNGLAVNKSR